MSVETVRISKGPSGDLCVYAPFNRQWVDRFKRIIPSRLRRPVTDGDKFDHWDIDPSMFNTVVKLCKGYGWSVVTNLDIATEDAPRGPKEIFQSVLEMLPEEDRGRLYRLLSQAFHPDAGGSNDLMRDLNGAFDSVNKENVG